MSKKKVWIVGHKNPDTDSICAAIAYADLKNRLEERDFADTKVSYEFIPKRAGDINAETAYVLSYFNVEAPKYIADVGTQLKDIAYRKIEGARSHISMKKAWEMMKNLKIVTLPIVNDANKLEGIIVTGDIAESYMDVYDNYILSKARTQYKNILDTLEGQLITGNEHGHFLNGKVIVATDSVLSTEQLLERDDLLIVGDNEDMQLASIKAGCSCIVVTNGMRVTQSVIKRAEENEVVIITTPYDSYTVARLINQSMPIKYFMTRNNIVSYELDDFVTDVKNSTSKIRHRYFPILDEDQNYVGMFSPRNLLNAQKKQIILVDHNEKSQAVNNVEEAEILEIIDHHRLGTLETIAPVYFRNQPLGCTSTIIYQMYQEKGIEIPTQIAGLLCAAIISDTLMFRSPTCTAIDRMAGERLAEIADVNIETFAYHMFEAASDFESKTEEEILNQDFKIFYSGDASVGVSQVMAMGQLELERVGKRIRSQLAQMRGQKKVDVLFIMLTDILNESTELLFFGDDAEGLVKQAFHKEPEGDSVILRGVVSRKKQLIPALMRAMAER